VHHCPFEFRTMNSSKTSGGGARYVREYQSDARGFLSDNAPSSNGRPNRGKRKSMPIDNTAIPSLKPNFGGSDSSGGGPSAASRPTPMEHKRSRRQEPRGLALARERQSKGGVSASSTRPETASTKGSGIVTTAYTWAESKIQRAFKSLSPPTTTTTRENGISFNHTVSSRPPTRSGRHQQQENEKKQNQRLRQGKGLYGKYSNEGQEEVVVDQQIDKHRSHQQVAQIDLCDSDDDTVDDTKETKKRHSPTMTPADYGRSEHDQSCVEDVQEYDALPSNFARDRQVGASTNHVISSHPGYESNAGNNAVSSPSIPRKKQKQVDGQFASNSGQRSQLEDQRFPFAGSSNDDAPQRAPESALMSNSQSTWNDDSKDHAQRKRLLLPTVNGQNRLRKRAVFRNESLDTAGKASTHNSPQHSTSTHSSLKQDDTQHLTSLASPPSSPVATSAKANSKSFGKLNNVHDLICSSEHEESPVSSMDARRCVERISESQRLVAPSRRLLSSGSGVGLGLSKQNGTQKSKSV
jgi:hypothetical protein